MAPQNTSGAVETQSTIGADVHLQRLLSLDMQKPWYHDFLRNVADTIRPPKLPPLAVTSKPVAVKDIWGQQKRKRALSTSVLLHVFLVVLAAVLGTNRTVQHAVKQTVSLVAPDLNPWVPEAKPQKQAMGGGGGGGDNSPLPASKGRLPRVSPRQFVPPMAVVNNPNPKLLMEPTIIAQADVQLPNVNMAVWGDPFGKLGPPSNGPGSGGGIGSGSGGGVGSGDGPGFGPGRGGGVGGGVYKIGGGVSAPQLVFKVEPEYSDEARRAKFQGTVVLYVVVDEKGMPRDMKVVRPLGLGLDEKAVEAVTKWRFKPGYKDGRPVAVAATIEVNFRLL
ncbi:MAG: energy transducer TonB [Acidobacteria bacterium]|nr:energy transducer TonB [Acidobacteriota bacterium]